MIIKFSLPVFLLMTILFLWFWGWGLIINLILSYLVSILIMMMLLKIQKMDLPFTLNRESQQQGNGAIHLIFSMILMALSAWLIDYTSNFAEFVTLSLCFIITVLIMLTFRSIRKLKFSRV
ncbi:MAG: hypothetical protein IPN68_08960 [Bacteroidetes bacterium]|nr:hypothetical protein [Bacteroidota bacterium]